MGTSLEQVQQIRQPWVPPRAARLLDQVRERVSYLRYTRTEQELLGHSDASTPMIYSHVVKVAAGGTVSPLDAMAFEK